VYRWKAQDLIDRGLTLGTSTSERGELAVARQRIKELETGLALVKQAAKLFEEGCAQKPNTRSSLSWPGECPGSSADVVSGTGSYVGSRASRIIPGHHLRSRA
jgi:hypothetical protein